MSVQDVIKKSVLESEMFNQAISLSTAVTIAVDLTVALLMGVLIYFVYKKMYQGVVYSRNYAVTLVGMTVLTCMVTLAISTNIVISLGMVGALSIVRYRTAVKEPLDLLYMFWAITSGITIGASMYILAAASAVIVILVLAVSHRKGSGDTVFLLIVHFTKETDYDEIIRIFGRSKYNVRSRVFRDRDIELTVEVRPSRKQDNFAEKINRLESVTDVTALQYNGEYHG